MEKERENQNLKQEVVGLKKALKDANDQCVLLYSEVQRAWKVSFTLQSDLKVIKLHQGSCLACQQFFITFLLLLIIRFVLHAVREYYACRQT